jgi:hypothetical protein
MAMVTLGQIINAIIMAGLDVLHVAEHPEPFWRPRRLPNTFSLLAQHRQNDE